MWWTVVGPGSRGRPLWVGMVGRHPRVPGQGYITFIYISINHDTPLFIIVYASLARCTLITSKFYYILVYLRTLILIFNSYFFLFLFHFSLFSLLPPFHGLDFATGPRIIKGRITERRKNWRANQCTAKITERRITKRRKLRNGKSPWTAKIKIVYCTTYENHKTFNRILHSTRKLT